MNNKKRVIEHDARARQLILFQGLESGRVCVTDIDGVIEINDEYYIFIEFKAGGKDMPGGQNRLYESLVGALQETGKRKAIALHVNHDTPVGEDVLAHSCEVVRFNRTGKRNGWHKPQESTTLKQALIKLRDTWGIPKLENLK